MTTDLLFDAPEQPSPRLAWMRKHHVTTLRFEKPEVEPWCAWVLSESHNWNHGKPRHAHLTGYGYTEDEAIAALALKRGWKLWNEEEAL